MTEKREEHMFFGRWKDAVDRVAVAAGLAETVPAEEEAREEEPRVEDRVPRPQPSVPGAMAPQASDANADDAIGAQFEADFPATLAAIPLLQNFLAQRAALMETLRGTIPDDKLEEAATKAVLAIARPTPKDVAAAMLSARAALGKLKGDFDASLAQARRDRIEMPMRNIQQSRKMIQELEQQIADLQRKKMDLEGGIAPQEAEIQEARSSMERGVVIFGSSCAKIEQELMRLQEQLTPKGEK